MTSGDFFERIDQLEVAVGYGDIEIKLVTDQVYAKYQELRDDLKHPRGGRAHYARDALFDQTDDAMTTLARGAITESGSDLVGAAIDASHGIKDKQFEYTPKEFVNLARSIAVTVTDDGAVVYDRPADVHRLSSAELRAQHHHGHSLDYGAGTNPRLEMP